MAELVVVGFDNPTDADRVLTELTRMQKEYLIDLEDAVVAIRRPGWRGSHQAEREHGEASARPRAAERGDVGAA